MSRGKLKLYVWTGVNCDWTCGIAFALARSEEEARRLILAEDFPPTNGDLKDEPDVHDGPIAYSVYGGG